MTISEKGFGCLTAAVMLGDFFLWRSFGGNLLDDLIAPAAAFLLSFVGFFLLRGLVRVCCKNRGALIVLAAVFAPLLLLSAFICLTHFSEYASSVMLGGASLMFPFVTVGLISALAARKKEGVVAKLGVVLFPLTAVLLLVILAFSARFVTPSYLIPHMPPTLEGTVNGSLKALPGLFSSVLPLAVMGRGLKNRGAVFGFVSAALLALSLSALTAGLLTSELASALIRPFSSAVGAASMGQIFSRLDGFLYAVCFFCCLLKTSACFVSAASLLREGISAIKLKKN